MTPEDEEALLLAKALAMVCLQSSSQEEVLDKTKHGVALHGKVYNVREVWRSIREFYMLPEKRERSTDAS